MGPTEKSISQKGNGHGSEESIPKVKEGFQTPGTGERASPTHTTNSSKLQHVAGSALSPAMQRWLGETMREEPYHAVGAVASAFRLEGRHKKQDQTDSDKAVGGSDKGKKE